MGAGAVPLRDGEAVRVRGGGGGGAVVVSHPGWETWAGSTPGERQSATPRPSHTANETRARPAPQTRAANRSGGVGGA